MNILLSSLEERYKGLLAATENSADSQRQSYLKVGIFI